MASKRLIFKPSSAKPAPVEAPSSETESWKVLLVDDEPDVHNSTNFVLRDATFQGRPITLVSAKSSIEAREILGSRDDIALALVDVVMETDTAGLDLIRWIRGEHGNKAIRLVIRTGQPGQAPEHSVIVDYDINDYKEKTELTSQKLLTLIYASLRAYRDIVTIEKSRAGLMKVIDASTRLFEANTVDSFATGILEQIANLVTQKDALYALKDDGAFAATLEPGEMRVVAGTGRFKGATTLTDAPLDSEIREEIEQLGRASPGSYYQKTRSGLIAASPGKTGRMSLLYFPGLHKLRDMEERLVEVFVRQVLTAFENLHVHELTNRSQREMVFRLGEAVETRSRETGNHVKRVARFAQVIGKEIGMSIADVETMFYAAPLHDVGKIGIPDSILNKPGRLEAHEWALMQQHTQIGHDLLAGSPLPIMKTGARIALEHHEKWNGEGYPNRLKGDDIMLEARIIGLVDVFDALSSDRVYKAAWPLEQVLTLIRDQRGAHFQPDLVDCFLDNLDRILEIQARYADQEYRKADLSEAKIV